jgi:hypothetical protein
MREHPGTFTAGLVLVVIGIAYLLDVADLLDVRPLRLWPILLIAVGAVIILGARRDEDRS